MLVCIVCIVRLSVILRYQSTCQGWTKHFLSRGRSIHEAFGSWKSIYNTSRTLCLVSFVSCTLRHCYVPDTLEGVTIQWASYMALGIFLVLINFYSSVSAYSALGDFAYFFGDFFIPVEYHRPQTRYSGTNLLLGFANVDSSLRRTFVLT